MKKEMWKQLLQIIITILTAISSSLFVQSCVKSHSSSSTVRQYAPTSSRQQPRLTRGIANEAGSSASATIMWCDATGASSQDVRNGWLVPTA